MGGVRNGIFTFGKMGLLLLVMSPPPLSPVVNRLNALGVERTERPMEFFPLENSGGGFRDNGTVIQRTMHKRKAPLGLWAICAGKRSKLKM
jgi:hypothetical protein